MLENLIVGLIVGAAGWQFVQRYVRKPKQATAGGCGSGCSSCDTCETAPPATNTRVIKIHRAPSA